MTDLFFPIAALVVTFLLLIPALTWASHIVLARTRRRVQHWTEFGSETTFALLVAPVLVPLLWLVSSVVHQNEVSQSSQACHTRHEALQACFDAPLLLCILVVGLGGVLAFRIWKEWPRDRAALLPQDHPSVQRIARLTCADPALQTLRVGVVHHAPEPVYTRGFVRPCVVLDACFVQSADDAMLHAALLHEYAHIRQRDTARDLVVRFCFNINPARTLLRDDFERWRQAREARCDCEAVKSGGDPLALAQSLVSAARFRCTGNSTVPFAAHLCGHHEAVFKLRLALLLHEPTRAKRTAGHIVLALSLGLVGLLPHVGERGVWEHFHRLIEQYAHIQM